MTERAIYRLMHTFKFYEREAFSDPGDPLRWVTVYPGLIDGEYARQIFGDYFERATTDGTLVREAPERSEA